MIADVLDQVIRVGVYSAAQADRHPPHGQIRTASLALYGELSRIVTLDDPKPAVRRFIEDLRDDIQGIEVLTPAQAIAASEKGEIVTTPVHILIATLKQNVITMLAAALERDTQ